MPAKASHRLVEITAAPSPRPDGEETVADARRLGLSAYYVGPILRSSVSAFATVHGDWGAGVSLIAQYQRYSGYVSARYVNASRPRIEYPDDPETFRFVNGSSLQLSCGVGYQFGANRVGITGQWQKSDRAGQHSTYSVGPNAYIQLIRSPRHDVHFVGEFLKTDQGFSGLAKIVWRWGLSPKVLVTADAGAVAIRSDANREFRERGSLEMVYQPDPILDHEVVLQPSIVRDGPLFIGGTGSVMGPLGRGTVTVRHGIDGPRSSTSYGATVSTAFAADARGVALGGRESHPSGVIVKVRGPAAAGRWQVFVNGSPKLVLSAGQSRLLPLQPYRSYDLALKPVAGNNTLTSLANIRRTVILYPGTAQTMEWNVEPVTVVFGRAVEQGGAPVSGARIEGAVSEGETDEHGYFQVEINGAGTLILKREGRPDCVLKLVPRNAKNGFARAGTVACATKWTATAPRPGKGS